MGAPRESAGPPALDLLSCLASLDLPDAAAVPEIGWLEESCTSPDAFWAALAAHAGSFTPRLRTRAGVAIDLYYDAVGRHAATDRIALIAHTPRGWQSLSYADLDARAAATAGAWAKAGLVPGAVVALVLPLGPEWLVALAAALRLGLVISHLAPAGERLLLRRLDALKPAGVVADPIAPPPLGKWASVALRLVDDGPPPPAPPHAYAPGEPCAQVFSPLRAPVDKPVPLSAEIAHQNALRDAVFAYRLAPGDLLAMPGFHPQQHQPAALVATLLTGATFVHLPLDAISKSPAILREKPITVLGVAPALMEILRARPAGLLPRHWFRGVDEPLDWIAWTDFVQKNGWGKLPSSNLLVDAAAGGCLLISTRRPGGVHALALPAPGRAYAIFDPASGKPAEGGTGLFVAAPGKEPKDGFFLLASRRPEYLYGSTLAPRRAARVFPAAEVTELVESLPGVEAAGVVPLPTGEPGARWAFALVVFSGAPKAAPPPEAAAIGQRIQEELGEDFLPDRVEVVPLVPRRKGRKLDLAWCHRQYSAGLLQKKSEHPVFQRFTALRGAALEG